jgi:4-amino-4-deoxy-L-arabinose transferase-like glycosyltransferase
VPPNLSPKTYSRWLAAAAVSALAVRLLVAAVRPPEAALQSSYEHTQIARNLCEGKGFSWNFFSPPGQTVPTSQQAPLVPYVLAAAYVLFGVESPAAVRAVLGLQALVSTATVLLLARLARRTTGSRGAAIVAAVLAAFAPPFVAAVGRPQALVWNLAALAGLTAGAVELRAGRLRLGSVFFLPSAILAFHSDPVIAAVAAVLVAYLAAESTLALRRSPPTAGGARTPWRRAIFTKQNASLAAVALLTALAATPWAVRNRLVHGRWMFVKDSFGYVFWQGNTRASMGTDKLPLDPSQRAAIRSELSFTSAAAAAHRVRRRAISVDASLPNEFLARLWALPTETARMDAFRDEIARELRSNPRQYLDKCLLRARQWVWFDETNPNSHIPAYRVYYIALGSLALCGAWVERRRGSVYAPIYVAASVLTAVHVLIITSARFRVPLELLVIPLAAAAVHRAAPALLAARDRIALRWTPRTSSFVAES